MYNAYGEDLEVSDLSKDTAEGVIRDNKLDFEIARDNALNASSEYGGSDALPLQEIIQRMIEAECWMNNVNKNKIEWNPEDLTINEALEEACIILGLDSEEEGLIGSYKDEGFSITIRLVP